MILNSFIVNGLVQITLKPLPSNQLSYASCFTQVNNSSCCMPASIVAFSCFEVYLPLNSSKLKYVVIQLHTHTLLSDHCQQFKSGSLRVKCSTAGKLTKPSG